MFSDRELRDLWAVAHSAPYSFRRGSNWTGPFGHITQKAADKYLEKCNPGTVKEIISELLILKAKMENNNQSNLKEEHLNVTAFLSVLNSYNWMTEDIPSEDLPPILNRAYVLYDEYISHSILSEFTSEEHQENIEFLVSNRLFWDLQEELNLRIEHNQESFQQLYEAFVAYYQKRIKLLHESSRVYSKL